MGQVNTYIRQPESLSGHEYLRVSKEGRGDDRETNKYREGTRRRNDMVEEGSGKKTSARIATLRRRRRKRFDDSREERERERERETMWRGGADVDTNGALI